MANRRSVGTGVVEGSISAGELSWDHHSIFDDEVGNHLGRMNDVVESVVDAALELAFGRLGTVPECSRASILSLSDALRIVCNPGDRISGGDSSGSEDTRVATIIVRLVSNIVQGQTDRNCAFSNTQILTSLHLLLEIYVLDYIRNLFNLMDGAGTSVKLSEEEQDRKGADILWLSPGGSTGCIDVKSISGAIYSWAIRKDLRLDGKMYPRVELILPGCKTFSMVADMLLRRLGKSPYRMEAYDRELDLYLRNIHSHFFISRIDP